MTVEDIEQEIAHIRACAGDPEIAHGREDQLYRDFVRFLAKEAPEPYATLAAAILQTRGVSFPRWCA